MKLIRGGLSDYNDMLERQLEIREGIKEGSDRDTLIVTHHRPTITLGKSASRDNLLSPPEIIRKKGISVIHVDRGGGVTYHGPGQIVFYPICDLHNYEKDLRGFIRNLEEVMKETADSYGLQTQILDDYPGLWMKDRSKKLGSLGLSVKNWITYHGLAFNVNLDEEKSSLLRPCGMKEVSLVSLADYRKVSMKRVKVRMLENFQSVFEIDLED